MAARTKTFKMIKCFDSVLGERCGAPHYLVNLFNNIFIWSTYVINIVWPMFDNFIDEKVTLVYKDSYILIYWNTKF